MTTRSRDASRIASAAQAGASAASESASEAGSLRAGSLGAEAAAAAPAPPSKSSKAKQQPRAKGDTPVRRQYLEIKARHPDAILFFRLGDFYETFDDDAELCARELEIQLSSKPMGKGLRVPLAGVPVHAVEHHLTRLIAKGHRVAICEQLEDAKATKGLVARGVVRVVSPGTALEPALLEAGTGQWCAALALEEGAGGAKGTGVRAGIAAIDLSTGQFRVCELGAGLDVSRAINTGAMDAGARQEGAVRRAAGAELARLGVRELLLPEDAAPVVEGLTDQGAAAPSLTSRAARTFDAGRGAAALRAHFGLSDVEGLGLAGKEALLAAVAALLDYLGAAQPETVLGGGLRHLERPRLYQPEAAMQLDAATERALGLFGDGRAATKEASLLALLDRCRSAAGKRLLREWLQRPLLDLAAIEDRLDRVALLNGAPLLRARLGRRMEAVPDLERLLGRVSVGLARPPELARLGAGLEAAAGLAALFGELPGTTEAGAAEPGAAQTDAAEPGGADATSAPWRIVAELPPCREAAESIAALISDDPPATFEEGGVVRAGVDAELDRLRAQLRTGRAAIASLEQREREATGIANLKIGFHRTFGYYLEVSRSQQKRVPPEWERRQTLAGGERYVTEELRGHERTVLAAREGLATRERDLFQALCRELSGQAEPVRALASGAARLDVALALADSAAAGGWCRPVLDHSDRLTIRAGRHAVVEAALGAGVFVPNDTELRGEAEQLLLITGPNMAGKSTYLRQTALIVLLAQIGSYVPAEEAQLGLVDRIFARVGAQDDLVAGQSTFMVEMLETAAICAAATERSLLVLDEIGRGTSTYDGLAIAQALLEHLVSGAVRGPRTLFATHFHELTALAGRHERVVNYTVAVAETGAERGAETGSGGGSTSGRGGEPGDGAPAIEFLYRIVPGGADRSYGLHVARMAGLPSPLVARAEQILAQLEGDSVTGGEMVIQAGLFPAPPRAAAPDPPPLTRDLAAVDVDNLTPLEALGALHTLRERARRDMRALGEMGTLGEPVWDEAGGDDREGVGQRGR